MNLLKPEQRLNLIGSIESEPNKARKQWSLRQFEVNGGRIQQYVKENLEAQLYDESVREMPIVSSINIQKAIVDKKATIYKKQPERNFTEISEEQEEKLKLIYRDMKLDMKLNTSNKNFVYQDQSIGMIIPKNGKLIARIFLMHQIDIVPDPVDPEAASVYVISCFDRENYQQLYQNKKEKATATGVSGRSVRSSADASDGENEIAANEYQYKKYVMKYIVWSDEYNFMMNGMGEIIDQKTGEPGKDVDIVSPLASEGISPFFEVSKDKDFEYFVRASNSLTDFTIQFNERLSDLAMNAKMNGYAVAILKTPSDVKPQNMVVGHSQVIHLPTDDPDKQVDFAFASPQSNISEISDANDRVLNYFVTSEGLGSDVVNSKGDTEKATSGIDRFLQSIKKMEAHQDDYEKYRCLESDIYEIIKAWLRVLAGDKKLDAKYQLGKINPDSEISVDFYKPEMMQTETERLTNIETKLELGLMSKREAIMELREIDDPEKADEILKEIGDIDIDIESMLGKKPGEPKEDEDETE